MTSVIELLPHVSECSRARLFIERMSGVRKDAYCYFCDGSEVWAAKLIHEFKDIEPIEKWGGEFLRVPGVGRATAKVVQRAIKVWQDRQALPGPWFEFAF